MKCKDLLVGLLMLGTVMAASPAWAEDSYVVGANESQLININGVSRVAVADPSVADVVVVSPSEMLLVGKKAGATDMYVWVNGNPIRQNILVNGTNEVSAAMVKEILGCPNVDVTMIGGKVLLEGTVKDQYEKNRCEKVASAFGEVMSMIEMDKPRQVRVECRILDLSIKNARELGVRVTGVGDKDSASDSNGIFQLGQSIVNSIDGNIFHWFGSYAEINAQINALVTKGNGKVLSQPYIITMSGEKANVHIGGQIATTSSSNDTVNTEWKDYGIKLEIEPIVQNNGSVDSKIKTEVSSLDYANKSNEGIPGILTRTADTHVMMKPGMTMAIGGLISSEEGKSINKIPLLGDIPILGQFFRYTSKSKERHEIVILLTPVIVDSDYMPVMSDEARRLSSMKDEQVLAGEMYVQPKTK